MAFPPELINALQSNDRKLLEKQTAALGYADPPRAASFLEDLRDLIKDPEQLTAAALAAAEAPDQEGSIACLERLWGSLDDATKGAFRLDAFPPLLRVLGSSPFLSGILCRQPDLVSPLFLGDGLQETKWRGKMLEELEASIPADADFATLQHGLRIYKQREYARIGSRDLCGHADLASVTADLSTLASATIEIAYRHSRRLLTLEHGDAIDHRNPDKPVQSRFTVLGMGKFGGNELNFSSDVDLIYFYDTDGGETAGVETPTGARKGVISIHQFFCKLGEMIARAIGAPTNDGFVFRVDLRLRPEGNSGEVAISGSMAELYYQSWGQSWERAALIKARPIAGSLEYGEEILARLEPFIFRRYLDFGMVEDIKVMKRKIDQSLVRKQERQCNLKLGEGGIREIEFFIQTMQLVKGGKQPELRERNSLKALVILRDQGIISKEDYATLSEAYIFLRTIEHRIQVEQERQTHNLPAGDREMLLLARRSGFPDTLSFMVELGRHRQAVHRIFTSLFRDEEEDKKDDIRPEIRHMLDPNADPDLIKDHLEAAGFKNPDSAYESIALLRDGRMKRPLNEQGRRLLDRIVPNLLQEIVDSPDSDQALVNLERFLGALRARSTFFALLNENRNIIKLLVSLFGTSQFMSRIFVQHPEILDSLVSRSYSVGLKDRVTMEQELRTMLDACSDFEATLDMLRRYRNEEFLRIAFNDLAGNLGQTEVSSQLSQLADICLGAAVGIAREEIAPRFGMPDPERESSFAIVAMGKHGGGELNYHSDLDIIFIYEGEGFSVPGPGTDPERFRQLGIHEYYSKLAQRIISALTLITREGYVYQIDTRLRPSGNQGPLVTSFKVFNSYHQESAQLWERQALSKARVAFGDARLTAAFDRLQEELVYVRPLPENVAGEIARLRLRMEKEIAKEGKDHFNIKTGRGGMVDVEFIVQYLQLTEGRTNPSLRSRSTLQTLKALQESGLLAETDFTTLYGGYKFLRRLENKLRILHDQSINDLSADREYLLRLARHLGYPAKPVRPDVALLEEYKERTLAIREVYGRIFPAPVTEPG